MPGIFLSYARSDDEPFVARLHADLTARGFDVWWDRVSMPGRALTFLQEIRDAVDARDRLVLVVGPRALASAYVEAEWRYALQVGKAINPVMRLSDFSELPRELALLDARDFRRDDAYEKQFERLVEQLSEPVARMGKLIGVPALPPHFIDRADRLAALKDAVLADLQRPVLVTGAAARTGIQGMGGIGKSVLASAMARDHQVRRAFPDGLFWLEMGQQPNLLELQRRMAHDLGDAGEFESVSQGRSVLANLLASRAVMLILDDVWDSAHADAFNVLGPRCRAVLTTRDASLLTALGGTQYQLQLLTAAESISLLASWAEQPRESLPPAAHEVVQQCGRLPLALALCGALARDGVAWTEVLEALREADLEFLDHPHGSVLKSIKVSVDRLEGEQARRFAELAVFPTDEMTPEAAVATLWSHTSGLAGRHVARLLTTLERRSLVRIETDATATAGQAQRRISLHDLVHDYAARLAGEPVALHGQLLQAYAKAAPRGWPLGPDDGYYFQHLRYHLPRAGRAGELVDLALDGAWIHAKGSRGMGFDLLLDFAEAQRAMPRGDARSHLLPLLDRALRRDLPFVTRRWREYPQALWQSLWNACWWYDSPDTARFYGETDDGAPQPWNLPRPKLSELAASWPRPTDAQGRPLAWLRSLRPPLVPLDTPLVATMQAQNEPITCLAPGEEGTLFTGDAGGAVRLWNLDKQSVLWELRDHRKPVATVLLHRESQSFGSIDAGGLLCVYDNVPRPRKVMAARNPLPDHAALRFWFDAGGQVHTLLQPGERQEQPRAQTQDGLQVTSAGRKWVAFNAATPSNVYEASLDYVFQAVCAMSRTGEFAGLARSADVWVWRPGEVPVGVTLPAIAEPRAMCVLADGSHAVLARGSTEVTIVRMADATIVGGLPATPSATTAMALTPGEDQLITGHADGSVSVWSMREAMAFLRFQGARRTVAAWFPRGAGVYVRQGSEAGDVSVEDIDGNSVLLLNPAGDDRVASSCVAAGRLAINWRSGRVNVYDIASRAILATSENPPRSVSAMALAPAGDRLYLGHTDGRIGAVEIASGRLVAEVAAHDAGVSALAFSADGQTLVSGSWDHHVRVWEASDFQRRLDLAHADVVTAVAVSPAAPVVASGSWDRTIMLWNIRTGAKLAALEGHKSDILRLEFSRDGSRLYSESKDQTVAVWDVARGTLLRSFDQRAGASASQMASASGATAVTRDADLAVVNVETADVLAWYPAQPSAIVKHAHADVWVAMGQKSAGDMIVLALEPAPGDTGRTEGGKA